MDFQAFAPYLSIVVIILAVVVTALVLMQSKGSDLAGFLGGGDTGGFRTKRGVEASLHRMTIYFSIAFFIFTFLAFIAWGLLGA
jgi:protein translocase SecG subunit